MKGIAEDGRNPFILSWRKTGREGTLCHLVGIPSGCFCFQDIGCVCGKLPASRETYWITDNLGMDRASTEGVCTVGEGGGRERAGLLPQLASLFCFLFLLSHSMASPLYSLVVKSMPALTLNMSTPLAFIVPSKLYLSSPCRGEGMAFPLHRCPP